MSNRKKNTGKFASKKVKNANRFDGTRIISIVLFHRVVRNPNNVLKNIVSFLEITTIYNFI